MISRIYLAALFTCMVALVLVESGNIKQRDACQTFGVNPYFEPKMLLGSQWRIYYSWKIKMKDHCLAMNFSSVNPSIVSRFYKAMSQYLVEQPQWNAAILHLTMSSTKAEMLLFAAFGPPGRVHGVINLSRDPNFKTIIKKKKIVPLMHYQMKLIQGGQYLGMMECLGGTVTLSTRDSEVPPFKSEVELVARKLAIGPGSLACYTMRNATERPDYDKK